jgi:hypothetical protein
MQYLYSLAFASSLCAASLVAQTTHLGNPLWENFEYSGSIVTDAIDMTSEPIEEANSEVVAADSLAMGALSVPEVVDAEIVELAKGLNKDPLAIFNWVRNHIGYEHYYGIRKGAELTLLEGRGNDMDQSLLLAELLEAAGISSADIQYRRARHRMALTHPSGISAYGLLGLDENPHPGQTFEQAFGAPVPDAWSSLTDEEAKRLAFPMDFLLNRGTPDPAPWTGYTTMAFWRVWLQVTIDGTSYDLDPSFKTYETIEGLDLLADTGYSRSALLSTAGGSTGTGYVQNLNNASIGTYLDGPQCGYPEPNSLAVFPALTRRNHLRSSHSQG